MTWLAGLEHGWKCDTCQAVHDGHPPHHLTGARVQLFHFCSDECLDAAEVRKGLLFDEVRQGLRRYLERGRK